MTVKPFRIDVPQDVLDDLHARLQRTRWPAVISGQNYGGPEIANMKEPAKKALRFNGRKKETELNKLLHFTTEIDGQTIHFSHVKSKEANATPLMLIQSCKIAGNTEKISCQ